MAFAVNPLCLRPRVWGGVGSTHHDVAHPELRLGTYISQGWRPRSQPWSHSGHPGTEGSVLRGPQL